MSHFYARIKGGKGEATRCGHKKSGITGHVHGWKIGARVCCYVDGMGDDVVEVYRTDGNLHGYSGKERLLARFSNKYEDIRDAGC